MLGYYYRDFLGVARLWSPPPSSAQILSFPKVVILPESLMLRIPAAFLLRKCPERRKMNPWWGLGIAVPAIAIRALSGSGRQKLDEPSSR